MDQVGEDTPSVSIQEGKLINFEDAFSSHSTGPVRRCECGKTFYDSYNSGYSWGDGEKERLAEYAIALPHSVGCVVLNGYVYVADCLCWHEKAAKVIDWLDDNAEAVAEWLTLEKRRKQSEADESPVVGS